ncbi:MAG: 23S rRNA (uracil(1939)-C(5))-methyltransferase RlmD [Cyanobacteria bacterium TGS_CYA1]|nr:23S rRNA (uracil(1939)-C(5))-methyltransferase RlmD [Cyanobacteria bacterium TGS_CYA1]
MDLTIESIAPGGEGVAKFNNCTIFVERAAVGDVATVRLYDVRKDFAKGKIEHLIESSKHRQEAPCAYFDWCGGCQWQHMTYEAQLEAKQDIVRQAMKRIGKLDLSDIILEPTMGADPYFRYRNKSQFPVQKGQKIKETGKRRLKVGYYERNSHDLVDINECLVQPEELDLLMISAKRLLEDAGIPAYDEQVQKGLLRHILIRQAQSSQQIIVTFVLFAPGLYALSDNLQNHFAKVAAKLIKDYPAIQGVNLNFNSQAGNRIMGGSTVTIDGVGKIEETLFSKDSALSQKHKEGIKFALSAASFFQINTRQTELILERIYKEVFGDTADSASARTSVILDAYAGVGTIALWLAPGAKRVVAIEDHPQAVLDGRANVEINNFDNIEFEEGDVEKVLPELIKRNFKPDCIVLDPPRKGVSGSVIDSVLQLAPKKIVYMSCNPVTLARDLAKLLSDSSSNSPENREIGENIGYKVERILPFDMFPQTYHVESLALLKRND